MFDSVIYEKLDDQIFIFLTYIWSLSTIPDLQLPKRWNFLSVESDEGVFCYVNKVTFGKHAEIGPGCQGSRPYD